jgi:DNA-binding transcriptional regulator YdaS (Cro superfamily)
MDDRIVSEQALADAIEKLGTQAELARVCEVSSTAVWKWVRSAKRVPPEFVLKVESATGISRHDLRPDIYPIENSGPHSPEAAPAAVSEYSVAGDRTSSLEGLRS